MITYALTAALVLAQAPAPAPQPAPPPSATPPPLGVAPPAPSSVTPAPQSLQVLRTLTLDEALRETQAKNFDLKVVHERLQQSRELHWKAWSNYLPHVAASGQYQHFDFPDVGVQLPTGYAVRNVTGGAIPAPDPNPGLPGTPSPYAIVPTGLQNAIVQKQNTLTADIQATQAIFAPQAWFGILAANAGERQAAHSAEESRQDILFSAAQIYYGAASLKQLITVQQRNLEIALDHERDAKVRYDAGTVPKVSLLRAQIDRSRAEQDLKRALNSYEESKVSLATLLGRDRAEFEVDIPAQPQLPADLGALHGDALRLRPDVLASREQVTVAERTRDGTIASYLPTVSAFARYDYLNTEGFTGRTTFWTIGLQASWTILDGFLRESDLRENQSKVREAAAARESTALKASEEVERARLDLDSATANRDKAKEQLDLARENQRLVNVNFKAGAATYIEVADANLELLRAAQTLVGETLNADLAALRLIKASGHFNPT